MLRSCLCFVWGPGLRFTKQCGCKTAPKVCNKVTNLGGKFPPNLLWNADLKAWKGWFVCVIHRIRKYCTVVLTLTPSRHAKSRIIHVDIHLLVCLYTLTQIWNSLIRVNCNNVFSGAGVFAVDFSALPYSSSKFCLKVRKNSWIPC